MQVLSFAKWLTWLPTNIASVDLAIFLSYLWAHIISIF